VVGEENVRQQMADSRQREYAPGLLSAVCCPLSEL